MSFFRQDETLVSTKRRQKNYVLMSFCLNKKSNIYAQ